MENFSFKNHDLPADFSSGKVQYRLAPVKGPDGRVAEGLFAATADGNTAARAGERLSDSPADSCRAARDYRCFSGKAHVANS